MTDQTTPADETPLQRACRLCKGDDRLGKGQTALAKRLNKKQSTIWNWLQTRVPADECLAIETATDGQVTRYELRPDVFGPPPAQPMQVAQQAAA